MKTFTLITLVTFIVLSSAKAASQEVLSAPDSSPSSLQAKLYKAFENYYPLEIVSNPVRKVNNGYALANRNGEIVMTCQKGYSCSVVKGDLNSAGQTLMQVLSNSGETAEIGRNYGYTLRAANYDLTCLYSARSLIVECKISKGTL